MSGGDVFQSLGRISELECFEYEVHIDPVVRLLVKEMVGERISGVEYVSEYLFVGFGG